MNVSRETNEKLLQYEALVRKWSPKINLVAKSTLESVFDRHINDCLQVSELIPKTAERYIDLGSGGGFPGIVVAIVCQASHVNLKATLIESDQRKATFLRTVSRETNTPFVVLSERIEAVTPQHADVVSARALANLNDLITLAYPHLSANGKCLFQKGSTWKEEVHDAKKSWNFACDVHKSRTNPGAAILEIGDISRV